MRELTCIKEYAGDIEQYGIDFLVGKKYQIVSTENEYIYVNTENGSDVMLSKEELKDIFGV